MKLVVLHATLGLLLLVCALMYVLKRDWLGIFLTLVCGLQMFGLADTCWRDVKRKRAFGELERSRR